MDTEDERHEQDDTAPDATRRNDAPDDAVEEILGYSSQPTAALPVEESGADAQPAPAAPEAEASAEPPLRVEIGQVDGSLTIIGGSGEVRVTARRVDGQIEATPLSDGVRFASLPGGAEAHVPDNVMVIVREVSGDLRCERLDGALRVSRVDRDAHIEDVRAARITMIAGDMTAERLDQLEVEATGGDAWIDGVTTFVMLGRISGDLEVRRTGALTVTEAVGGDAQVERSGTVTLEGPVGGDLELRRIEGVIRLTTTGGDLEVSDAREIAGRVVGGDLEMEGVAGRATFETVGGDADLRNTFGLVSLGVIGGDLTVERAPGGVSISRAGGDADLDTLLRAESKYMVNAGGDITLRVRGEVNARFVAQSFGGEIHTRLPLTVERGRRRNLVGSLGTGAATVTLQSGGDISIVAADGDRGAESMSDENEQDEQPGDTGSRDRTYEGNVAGRRFRVRVQNGPNHAGFQFKGPFTDEDEEQAREFNLEWERGRGAHATGEYSEQLDALRDRAEQLARRAGEEARKYADAAAKKAREADWEAVGREVRSTIERAMGDLEDAFGKVRGGWEPRGGSSSSGDSTGRAGGAQRVRIEHDDQPGADAGFSSSAASASGEDADALRRQVLEELRNGRISLDEAERRLNGLR